jgi:hypothetical protein
MYDANASGQLDLDHFANTADERAELQRNGFEGAWASVFLTSGQITAHSRGVSSQAGVYTTTAGAHAQYAWFRDVFIPNESQGVVRLPTIPLGDEEFGVTFTGTTSLPLPGAGYIWRRGNMILGSVVFSATNAKEQALEVARTMNARASVAS